MGPCPFLWRWLTILDLACGDIHDELRELRSIARAFEPSCGHIARRGSAALVIPSADRLGFHVCVCRWRLCLVAHAPTMPRLPGPFHGVKTGQISKTHYQRSEPYPLRFVDVCEPRRGHPPAVWRCAHLGCTHVIAARTVSM